MLKISRFFALVICFELILGQTIPLLKSNLSYAQNQGCGKGFEWDAQLNRCITSQRTATLMNSSSECAQNDAECYKKNAEAELAKSGAPGPGKDPNGFLASMGAASIATVSIFFLAGYSELSLKAVLSPCQEASFWAMTGSGAALIAGNLFADMQHKSRLKKIQEKWASLNNGASSSNLDEQKKNSLDNQSEAFELLAQAEESMARAANMKKTVYALGATGFAAAAVIAGFEIKPPTMGLCKPKPADAAPAETAANSSGAAPTTAPTTAPATGGGTKAPKYSSDQIRSLKDVMNLSFIPMFINFASFIDDAIFPRAHAKGELGGTAIGVGAGLAAGLLFSKQIAAFLIQPTSRAILSGVMSGWSLLMMSQASKQAQASEERAKILRKMKEDFYQASMSLNTCLPEDRTNTGKPECYCYTPEGQRNPARATSQICQNLFASKGFSTPKTLQADSFKGCINNQNKFDERCSCKQTKTCLKSIPVALGGLSTGTQAMVTSALAPIDQMANNALPANFNASAAANNAARILKTLKPETQNQLSKEKAKLEKNLELKVQDQLKKDPSFLNNLNTSMASSPLPTSPKDAALMLEKEIKKSDDYTPRSSGSNSSGSNVSSSEDFTSPLESTNTEAEQVAEVMGKEMDYGTNDISTEPSSSLFDQLSSRYRSTGMRRLFEEEKTDKK